MKSWYEDQIFTISMGEPFTGEVRAELTRELRREGEAIGERLVVFLRRRTYDFARELKRASTTDLDMPRHPSRLVTRVHDQDNLVDAWIANPDSIRTHLDADENERRLPSLRAAEEARNKS